MPGVTTLVSVAPVVAFVTFVNQPAPLINLVPSSAVRRPALVSVTEPSALILPAPTLPTETVIVRTPLLSVAPDTVA